MPNIDKSFLKKRLHYVVYAIFLAFFIIIVKLVYLSILGYKKDFSYYSQDNTQIHRYDIVDRHSNVLAIEVPSTSIYIRPKDIKDKPQAINALVSSLDLSREVAEKLVNSSASFLWVKRNITEEEDAKLKYQGVLGIYFQKETKRFYPYGSLFSHIVGMTDIDGKGVSGIENSFNDTLYERNLELSVDLKIQRILYDAIAEAVEKNQAKHGYGMVVDPNTGEVLAMVSLPDFNPNDRIDININNMFNYPTQGLVEFGSIAKVFSVAMALENGTYHIDDLFDVSKPIVNNSYVITDFSYMNRSLNIPEVLMYSSNIGTSIMMKELGVNTQIYYLNKFNLFKETSLELSEKTPSLTSAKWNELNSMTVSYGYGLAVSQATYINSFIAMINGGNYIPLTLLRRSENNIPKKRVLSEEVSKKMQRMLRLVVAKGSGRRGDVAGFSVGGKTGSAEKQLRGKYQKNSVIASFVAFFPSDNPKYVVIVSIDEPKRVAYNNYNTTGGALSAPIVKSIISQIATTFAMEKTQDNTAKVNVNDKQTIIDYVLKQGEFHED
ncbi:MAG: penicillin-binding protein 2 [Alphaproteobacteria bacterium]|jgi:cell division protein FtsI (penicillin-binding protein 3)|nr:penicillin-binding protein 2 [Alphaproteobacteria bacterium]